MRELSLYSGAGGGLLGTHCLMGWRTVGYVEINEFCQQIIKQRIADGIFDDAPLFGDIRAFLDQGYAGAYTGMVDVLTAGFPCQPFSVAGKRRGADDKRNLWPETIECIRIVQPRYAFLENVPGLLTSRYFGTILGDLAESGYDCRWRILSAAELGAPHRRRRLWILADSKSERRNHGFSANVESTDRESNTSRNGSALLADSTRERCGEARMRVGRSEERTSGICETIPDSKCIVSQAGSESTGWEEGANPSWRSARSELCDAAIQGFSDGKREEMGGITERSAVMQPQRSDWWTTEPNMGRMANGVADRVDRLIALGNGQVPIVAATAWRLLMEGK